MVRPHVIFALGTLLGMGMCVPARAVNAPGEPSTSELQKQAASGNAVAEVALGKVLVASKDPKDKAASVEWFRKAALQGNTDAQWLLGAAYWDGNGVPRDPSLGLEWMRKSLSDGSTDHMVTYGGFLGLQGMLSGQPNDGLAWIRRAADAGSTKGMSMLGLLQLNGGMGASKDKAAAEQWFLKAANAGDADAQLILGSLYIWNGFDHTDVAAGVRWLREAAQHGQAEAQGTLGYLLISGDKGVPKNPVEGVQWADKAVLKNDSHGHYALGFAYQYGDGKPKDPAQAWYHLAAAARLDAKHELSKVGDHMSEVATQLSAKELAQLQAKVQQIPVPTPTNPG
ncbi:tetratricopeptide repeat protein [Rhodanobacter koreensis]